MTSSQEQEDNLPQTCRPDEVVASLDFGSNTVGYLIACLGRESVEFLGRGSRFVRLAEGFEKTPRINNSALERLRNWLLEMKRILGEAGAGRLRAVGTEAVRRAQNQKELKELVQALLGVEVEVISGPEEGRLTYHGVRFGYPAGPLSVIDVGGGSTEVVLGAPEGADCKSPETLSLDLGGVTLTERFGEDYSALYGAVLHRLQPHQFRIEPAPHLTTLGGTGANLAMIDQGEKPLTDGRLEGHVLSRERIRTLRDRIGACSPEARVRDFGLPKGRADVVVAGLAILEGVMDHLGFTQVRTSRYALRHGVIWSMLQTTLGR